MKKLIVSLVALVLFISFIPIKNSASATSGYTFERFEYADEANTVLLNVYLKNPKGYVNKFKVDANTILKINNTATVPDGFKYGMNVQFERQGLGKLAVLQGFSNVDEGVISENSKEVTGTVVKIDPNGMFIQVKINAGKTVEYYLNKDTQYFKGTQSVDMSYMYEGDRIKLRFSAIDTKLATQVEIYKDGLMIENVYRGQIQMVNTSTNRLTVRSPQTLTNWTFGQENNNLKTFKFDSSTSIYYGNRKIIKSNIRQYQNSDAYFVTTKINGSEIIKKIVIIQNYERTYFNDLKTVNLTSSLKSFTLNQDGRFYMHGGTIIVRNGRLIEPLSLSSKGSAYVITDGIAKSNYSHVVNVVNDSFLSPNLASHELYVGQLVSVDNRGYKIKVTDLQKLENNFFGPVSDTDATFSFSNNTDVNRIDQSIMYDVTNMQTEVGRYGYFYVKDGHVRAIHFTDLSTVLPADTIHTGRVTVVSVPDLDMENVTTWVNGTWTLSPALTSVDLNTAMIIKNGELIEASDIKVTDRVVLLRNGNNSGSVDIVLVN